MLQAKRNIIALTFLTTTAMLTGCQATGEEHRSSTYTAAQVNQKQEAKTISIIAVTEAKVAVDNTSNQKKATAVTGILGGVIGGVIGDKHGDDVGAVVGGVTGTALGGIAGSAVGDTSFVEAVTLTYSENNKIYTSTQIGRSCEYKTGLALVVNTGKENETRVQPNSSCPAES
ncbi:hypothetical protein [Photobacterium leiognathi]|uniref:hypothetical protein n=1 Tax=Photobacterium leiognathi TaxID=553611 RepID=UPI0029820B11|nr:hypothetical protein [Photobacterium leiognathi]